MAVGEFLCHAAVANDRASDELREHRYVEQQAEEIFLYRRVTAVDVHQVRDGLKDVETDANGQGYLGVGDIEAELIERLDKHACVFEDAQDADVADKAEDEAGFLVFPAYSDDSSGQVSQEDASEHQEDVHRFSPSVEDEGEKYEHSIARREALMKRS